MALFRAIESSRPPDRRLFEDRFANLFLRPILRSLPALSRVAVLGPLVPWLIDSRWPGAMSAGIARTRYIDDLLRSALAEGIDQVVILGSGFDCRAYRIDGIERTRVFEIDQANTLDVKRRRLQAVFPALPPHVTFVETDFNQQGLEETMAREGFDRAARTFFIWEGVTNYLTGQAVDGTLGWFGTSGVGSRVVFTYIHRLVLEKPESFPGAEKIFRALAQNDEPWTFGLVPDEVAGYLAQKGLTLTDDLSANEFRKIYFGPERPQATGYDFYRIVQARVTTPSAH
jgi:methyltransferase (TIGR00027 family)